MSAIANALSGQSPDDLQSILAQLNQLLTPTEKLPGTQSPSNLLLAMPQAVAPTSGAPTQNSAQMRMPNMGGGQSAPAASGSSPVSSILASLANPNSAIAKAVSSAFGGGGISGTDAATWASGAPANSAVSAALGNVSNDGTAAAVEAANDTALGGLTGSLADFGSGAMADSAVASALGDVANDGTAAAVQAANDAALNATDGGAAGAAAGLQNGPGLGTALGALGSAYSLYNEAKNYQSGATGSDALGGAETGASIGTMIAPGVGTAIGALLGGAGGAIASAFGGGKQDPETQTWNSTVQQAASNPSAITGETPSQLYQNLAGMMDAKNNTAGHSTPLELTFGRMGEGTLMDQMAGQVNSAIAANPALKGDSASQMYSSVVEPWLKQTGAYVNPTDIVSSNGTQAGTSVDSLLTSLLGDWMGGSINANSKLGISGQTIQGLANYAGLTPQQLSAMNPSPVGQALNFGIGKLTGRA